MSASDKLVSDLQQLKEQLVAKMPSVESLDSLEELRVSILGKKGALTEVMKSLGALSADERPKVGQVANEVRATIGSLLDGLEKKLKSSEIESRLKKEKIDITLPGRNIKKLQPHPVQMVQDELVSILEKCGFLVEMGPEVEHEFYNFDALNFPPNHPARAMQDTFFVKGSDHVVMRTHTSPVQVRRMLQTPPPIRMCCPGKVYRSDYDATHVPVFNQIEGLLVDKNVTMADLKGILSIMMKEFFQADLKVRLRPSFFPFTEPSAEIDIQCCFCGGKGCKTCKNSGWIEIGGSGMVDPEVFKSVGLDAEKWRGFAFGMGLERMAMLKYDINDLRVFFESDARFISQFSRWRQ